MEPMFWIAGTVILLIPFVGTLAMRNWLTSLLAVAVLAFVISCFWIWQEYRHGGDDAAQALARIVTGIWLAGLAAGFALNIGLLWLRHRRRTVRLIRARQEHRSNGHRCAASADHQATTITVARLMPTTRQLV